MAFGDLIELLREADCDLSVDELCDVLWLARYWQPDAKGTSISDAPLVDPERKRSAARDAEVGLEGFLREDESASSAPDSIGADPDMFADVAGSPDVTYRPAQQVRLPGVSPLPNGLAIARALRPIARRRPGRVRVLDPTLTAQRVDETGLIEPVYRSRRERWHDVALVVESAPSLAAWRPMVEAFEQLLLRQAGLRSVRRWSLEDPGNELRLPPQLHSHLGEVVPPEQLADPAGRRLVLLLSDCTSEAWYAGRMGTWISKLSRSTPVSVLQPLPSELWVNTALGFVELEVSAISPAPPTARLRERRPAWARDEPGCVVPVVGVEPRSVLVWARMMAAAGGAWSCAALLPAEDPDFDPSRARTESTSQRKPGPTELLRSFRRFATPAARKLITYLATVRPLSPPVMRMIQAAMTPEGGAAALAQVILSGMLKRVGATGSNPEREEFDFLTDDLRLELVDENTGAEMLNTQLALHRYLVEQSGEAFEFTALICDSGGTMRVPELATPFLPAVREFSKRLGLIPHEEEPSHEEPIRKPLSPAIRTKPKSSPDPAPDFEANGTNTGRREPSTYGWPNSPMHYEHVVFLSYVGLDNDATAGWIDAFGNELTRILHKRLTELRSPETPVFAEGQPLDGPLCEDAKRRIEASFALIVFVHENYVGSGWKLEEVEHFSVSHQISSAQTSRCFIVALSSNAMKKLTQLEAWQKLRPLPEPGWLPFYCSDSKDEPVFQYIRSSRANEAVMSTDFLVPFLALARELLAAVKEASYGDPDLFQSQVSPKSPPLVATEFLDKPEDEAGASELLIYIESEPDWRPLWEALDTSLSEAWNQVVAADAGAPGLRLRSTHLPMHQLHEVSQLNNAAGVILVWGEKSEASLLAQIALVETKLPSSLSPALRLIACLNELDQEGSETVPDSVKGWPVICFRIGGASATTLVDTDRRKLDACLQALLHQHQPSSS